MVLQRFDASRAVEITHPTYGTGYRIGGRLVLTAKHLFPGSANRFCRVRDKKTFGEVDAEVKWIASGADVALVVLPEATDACVPIAFGRFPSEPNSAIIDFDLYGWPKWAQTTRPDEAAKAGGRHIDGKIYLADDSPEGLLVVESKRVSNASNPEDAGSEWSGISGAAVVCNGLVVAVQHHHQNPHRPESLEATLLSTVYDDRTWHQLLTEHGIAVEPDEVIPNAGGARKLTQSDSNQRQDYCHKVTQIIKSRLISLSTQLLKQVAEELYKLAGQEKSGIKLESGKEILADQTADCLVAHSAVADVLVCLMRLIHDVDQEDSNKVADIIDCILPLNYAPDVVQRLHQQVKQDQFGLVENEVTTLTLAEIIMAGYDEKPPEFKVLTGEKGGLRGATAHDYEPGPEVGFGDIGSERIGVLRAVRDVFCDMLAKFGASPKDIGSLEINTEIEEYALRLQGVLSAESDFHRGRTIYFVVPFLHEESKRALRKEVLGQVSDTLQGLVFVELAPVQKDPQEAKVAHYIRHIQKDIRVRLVRTQRGYSLP